MSHIVKIESRVHDRIAIDAACRRLGLTKPVEGTAKLYSGEATGLLLQLPDWTYPVVIEPLTGTIKYDNFGGEWGKDEKLHLFLQMYAVAKATLEARIKGHTVSEQVLGDGSIKLQIHEGG